MNTIVCAMNDLRLFTIELMRDIKYRTRGKTWRSVWAWFMVGHGLRLFVAATWAAYLLWAWL